MIVYEYVFKDNRVSINKFNCIEKPKSYKAKGTIFLKADLYHTHTNTSAFTCRMATLECNSNIRETFINDVKTFLITQAAILNNRLNELLYLVAEVS